jgi:thiol-disulfide isomerase/thioredoxin
VNYWAEWCVPCREEIPELNRLARGFAENTSVLGVNYDGLQAEALENAVAAMGIEFPSTGDDPSLSLKVPRPNVLPTTLVFDPEGKLAHTLFGPQTFDRLSALLGSASSRE